MGRGLNSALSLLDIATRPNCSYCGNKCKKSWWENDDYPSKKFCKKSCSNRYHKSQLQMADSGCFICRNKNSSLRYYRYRNKKFCKKSCLNKHRKAYLQSIDSGCSLCGKKNSSLKYFDHEGKKYCKKKHFDIGASDAIILKINYL